MQNKVCKLKVPKLMHFTLHYQKNYKIQHYLKNNFTTLTNNNFKSQKTIHHHKNNFNIPQKQNTNPYLTYPQSYKYKYQSSHYNQVPYVYDKQFHDTNYQSNQ